MKFKREELRQLAWPAGLAIGLLLAGGALIWAAQSALDGAKRTLAGVQQERRQNTERLERIVEEERGVKAKLDLYRRLQALRILGAERRLEWADAIQRIRAQRNLLDLQFRIDRQKLLASVPGKPAPVNFYGSTLRVDLALLHEEDLLRFLDDLRASGNAYYSVRECSLVRSTESPPEKGIGARLRGVCEVELITIVDQAAKK